MQTVSPQGFDVLVVDAFSSDAIPVHLLTRECHELYWKHIARDGLLIIHITNRHLNLRPIIRGLAKAAGKECRIVEAESLGVSESMLADWAIITSNREFLAQEALTPEDDAHVGSDDLPSLLWTDSFSSLWHVLR